MRTWLAAAVTLAAVAACGGARHVPAPGPDQVVVANFRFTPSTITVPVGTTVTWIFDEVGAVHNVYETSGSAFFSSDTMGKGTYRHAFTTPGTYTYECTIHPGMKGTVIVTQ